MIFVGMKNKQQAKSTKLSRLKQPKGVYLVILLAAAIACICLLDRSEYSTVWMVVSLGLFVLVMSLATGNRRIGQMVMVASLITAITALVGFMAYSHSVRKLNEEMARSYAIIAQTRERFTSDELKAVQEQDRKITALQDKVGPSQTITYLKYGALVIGYSAIVLYVSQLGARKRQ